MTWANLTTEERIAKVRQFEAIPIDRTTQATRLGIRLQTLSQFCSAHGLTAANTNTDSEWAKLDDAGKRARIIELREDSGMSTREIAVELGVRDHSTIYAFCRKNGLENLFETRVRVKGPPMVPARPVDPVAWEPVGGEPKTLMELDDHDCRWPVDVAGATKFCGCRAVSGSYCEVHALMSAMGRGTDA